MNALIVIAQPKRTGFNRSVAAAAAAALETRGYTVSTIDLYAESYPPVLEAEEVVRKFSFDEATLRYQEAIKGADRVVFVHPDWWGGPPAILKGFLDRVFRPGVAYGFREADFTDSDAPGLFADKRFDVFVSTDSAAPPSGKVLDWPPAAVWKTCVLDFCGVKDSRIHAFWRLRDSSYAERKAWLEEAGAALD